MCGHALPWLAHAQPVVSGRIKIPRAAVMGSISLRSKFSFRLCERLQAAFDFYFICLSLPYFFLSFSFSHPSS